MHHVQPEGLVRIAFLNISDDRFDWQADVSMDGGTTWDEAIYVIEAHRTGG